eukprot:CCRYP_001286-RC/>CCRYP_001286-RC protein AED:0.48 eAED:0.77 QI:0/0/0/1/0/0/3/0/87
MQKSPRIVPGSEAKGGELVSFGLETGYNIAYKSTLNTVGALPGLAFEVGAERDGVKDEDDGANAFAVATIAAKMTATFMVVVCESKR